jgi:uncharacterized protein
VFRRDLLLVCNMLFSIWLTGCSMPTTATSTAPKIIEATTSHLTSTPVSPKSEQQGQALPISARAKIGEQAIDLEVARTTAEQGMGLMYRPELPDNRGMLFPFDPPRPVRFWMKNVPVPLDMVFLRDGEIQDIEAEVPPCTSDPCPVYGPDRNVEIDRVIELKAGRAAQLGLQVGDLIEIEFLVSK